MVDKEAEDPQAEAKKKGLPGVVLIAVGAILGGAGVVFGMPKSAPEQDQSSPAEPQLLHVHVANNPMEFMFNPRSTAGKHFGQVSFTFGYKVLESDLEGSKLLLKERWKAAESALTKLLRTIHLQEWDSDGGLELIEQELRDELTYQLFPGANEGEHARIAKVTNIYWGTIKVQ